MNYEEELDRDVDSIIAQIKNQGKSLKNVEKEKPELKKEDLEKFVIENASSVVLDSIEMIQSLKTDILAGADPKMVESISELVKATTAAIESLSRLKLSEDRIKSQKDLKQMDIDSKSLEASQSNSGLFISREELIKNLFLKKEEKLETSPPTIDV
jgi:uncharacterized protein (DUF342 family)